MAHHLIDLTDEHTYVDKATAEYVARVNDRDDPEWSYEAIETPQGWLVVVWDEDGHGLGVL